MGRGPHLTETDKAVILAYHDEGPKPADIMKRIPVSRGAIRNAISNRGKKNKKPPIGKPRKIAPVTCRAIVRAALRGNPSARELRNQYANSVSVRTVQRLLVNSGRLGWRKMKRAPKLLSHHLPVRLKWAKEVVRMDESALRDVI